MKKTGSQAFLQFADNLRHVLSVEAEQAQQAAVARSKFRASLVERAAPDAANLQAAFAYHRRRTTG